MVKCNKKAQLLRLYNRILSGILALLGFAPCSDENEAGEIVPMYGMPSSVYKAKAKANTTTMAIDIAASDKNSVYILNTDKKDKHAV